MTADRRAAATAQHERAIAAISALFDRVEDLRSARERFGGIEPLAPDDDPIRDGEALIGLAEQLATALGKVREAADAAAEYRTRSELANDLGTRTTALFPRPARQRKPARPAPAPLDASHLVVDEGREGS